MPRRAEGARREPLPDGHGRLRPDPDPRAPEPEALEPAGPSHDLPDDPFQLAPNDPKRIAEEKADKEKADARKADQEKKIADGKKRVEGARRPVRQLVLRHSRHKLPLDRAGPRGDPQGQGVAGRRQCRADGGGFPGGIPRSGGFPWPADRPSLIVSPTGVTARDSKGTRSQVNRKVGGRIGGVGGEPRDSASSLPMSSVCFVVTVCPDC